MCMSPKIPASPPPPQEIKQPDAATARKTRNQGGMSAGTLLTGPSGVANAAASTGRTTLLGQ